MPLKEGPGLGATAEGDEDPHFSQAATATLLFHLPSSQRNSKLSSAVSPAPQLAALPFPPAGVAEPFILSQQNSFLPTLLRSLQPPQPYRAGKIPPPLCLLTFHFLVT